MNPRISSVAPIKPRLAALMVGLPINPRKRRLLAAKDFSAELRREIRDYSVIECSLEDAGAKFHLTARQVMEVSLYEITERIKSTVSFRMPFGENPVDPATAENIAECLKAGKPPHRSKIAQRVYWCFANDFMYFGSIRLVQNRYETSVRDTEAFILRFARLFYA